VNWLVVFYLILWRGDFLFVGYLCCYAEEGLVKHFAGDFFAVVEQHLRGHLLLFFSCFWSEPC